MTTTSQKHAELKRLGKEAAKSIYEMLRLADEILHDHDYVDQFGGEAKLIEMLEADEFAHFGGDPALPSMLRAYRANPKQATWREYKFNVRAMIELTLPEAEGAETQRINWKALAKDLQAKLEQAEAVAKDLRATNGELRAKCDQLLADNGEMRGRVAVLESFVKVKAA